MLAARGRRRGRSPGPWSRRDCARARTFGGPKVLPPGPWHQEERPVGVHLRRVCPQCPVPNAEVVSARNQGRCTPAAYPSRQHARDPHPAGHRHVAQPLIRGCRGGGLAPRHPADDSFGPAREPHHARCHPDYLVKVIELGHVGAGLIGRDSHLMTADVIGVWIAAAFVIGDHHMRPKLLDHRRKACHRFGQRHKREAIRRQQTRIQLQAGVRETQPRCSTPRVFAASAIS